MSLPNNNSGIIFAIVRRAWLSDSLPSSPGSLVTSKGSPIIVEKEMIFKFLVRLTGELGGGIRRDAEKKCQH